MKSSVRILAIALALAFLLLARTAFQEDTEASAAEIDLSNGEASFADPLDGSMEAKYLGFGGAATATVHFYIDSDDLGTQITARTMHTGAINVSAAGDETLIGGTQVYTLIGGNTPPSMVDGVGQTNAVDPAGSGTALDLPGTAADVTTVAQEFDNAYCATRDVITAAYTVGNLGADATTTIDVPGAWGLLDLATAVGTLGQCDAPGATGLPVDERMLVATTTDDTFDSGGNPITAAAAQRTAARARLATAAIAAANAAQVDPAIENNAVQYMYKSGNKYVAATSTNPARRYTNGVGVDATANPARPRDTVGGPNKPLDTVAFTITDTDADGTPPVADSTTEIPTFQSNKAGGEFRLAYQIPGADAVREVRKFTVDATFDIVDVYEATDTTASGAAYSAYTSGYGRAYVSSGSDSGQWVTITEVAAVSDDHDADGSPTSNLFLGSVVITNDTSELGGDNPPIYAQDGDTLTLQVFSSNGNRSSDVLASATALIDNSPPSISDLSPADESIISDDSLRISFDVNDDGAGSDFRNIEKVVTMVQVQARDESLDTTHKGTGTLCPLASGEDDIDNAGGNASRVGVLIAPANAKFSSRCGDVVNTGDGGKFNLIITAQDLAGNKTTHTTQLTIDTSKPVVVDNPSVGQAWDEDKNEPKSSANSILVKFNESLDVDTVAASDFTVAGYTIDTAEVVGTNDDDNKNLNKYVVLTLTEDLANNARPSVTVDGVSDVAGNAIQKATRTSDNNIKAKLTVVPFSALIAEDGEQSISFTSDEALRSKSGANSTKGSVNGDPLTVKVADDTMGGNATLKESAVDGSGAYGVMLQAVDIDGNVTRVGAVSVSDDDVQLDLDNDLSADDNVNVKLANWPPADSDLNGSFAGEVVAKINNKTVASSTNTVHWDGADAGKVQLLVGAGVTIKKNATLNLSYKYVTADQVVEVDVDAPTMTSEPEDNSETDNAGRAIQFIWSDDDGYAGDSHKTVTLNSAMHEGPSGTSTDITDMLTSHDSMTFVYTPSTDLEIGDHEFTVKATDAAGNSATETVTITITERKPIKINLRVGWNLISFPSMPASTDVNDIFSSDTISVVTQYDARRVAPTTAWTRGEDGTLSSSPAGRTSIDPGLGVYVLSKDGSPLEVITQPDDVTRVPPVINLIPGWNLVAVILIGDRTEVGVNEYLPQGEWTRAFRLNSLTGQFESFSPAPAGTDGTVEPGVALKAGDALWVYATEDTTIVPK